MKKLLIFLGIVILIVIIVLAVGVSNLGPLIKTAVNTYGPNITKTNVYVDDVGVSLLSGEAKLKGFVLGNPQGFTSPEAISVGSIYVNIDKKSLAGGSIVIDKIEVLKPIINYEKVRGTDNFQSIMNNLSKGGSSEPASADSKAPGTGKKIVIREFVLEEGKVNLAVSGRMGSKSASADIPEIHLKNLGGEKGVEPAEAARQILAAIYHEVESPGVTEAIRKSSEALGGAVEGAREDILKGTDGTGGQVQEELNKAQEKAKEFFK